LRSGLIAAEDARRLVASGIGTEAGTRDFDDDGDELDDEFCIASWCSRSGDREVGAPLPRCCCCWRRSSIPRAARDNSRKSKAIRRDKGERPLLFL
jgi:hypothetical protein